MQPQKEVEPNNFLWYLLMKKLVVTAALSLFCFLAFSQEADEPGRGNAEFSVVARGEYLHTDPLGNSSLYTLLDGYITEKLSYSVSNHWLSSDPLSLYANSLHSDSPTWLDWAYINYETEHFIISAGKMVSLWGTYENDEYDYDIHYPFASSVWNNLTSYQWGVSAGWMPWGEGTIIEASFMSSPYGVRPFEEGLFNAGLRVRSESDSMGAIIAYNVFNRPDAPLLGVLSSGVRFQVSPSFSFVWDNTYKVCDPDALFMDGNSSNLNFTYSGIEKMELLANFGSDHYSQEDITSYRCGFALHYYPVEDLRIHALVSGMRPYAGAGTEVLFSLGLTYKFSTTWRVKM